MSQRLNKRSKNRAFTLIELLISITILLILIAISFLLFQGYQSKARDSARIRDVSIIEKGVGLYNIKVGNYPLPTNGVLRTFVGKSGKELELWHQGTLNDDLYTEISQQLSKKPTDPLNDEEYIYSKTIYSNEYEILIRLENGGEKGIGDNVFTLNKIVGKYNKYYVKTKEPGTNNIVLIAVPTIISGNPNGTFTDKEVLSGDGKANIVIPGSIVDNSPEIKIGEVYSGIKEPHIREEYEKFAKNLVPIVEENLLKNPSLAEDSEFKIISSKKPIDTNNLKDTEKAELQELGKNIMGGTESYIKEQPEGTGKVTPLNFVNIDDDWILLDCKKVLSEIDFVDKKDILGNVDWYTATNYCSDRGMRLPTREEMMCIYANLNKVIGQISGENFMGRRHWTQTECSSETKILETTTKKENGVTLKTGTNGVRTWDGDRSKKECLGTNYGYQFDLYVGGYNDTIVQTVDFAYHGNLSWIPKDNAGIVNVRCVK